ncbi:c-type cytochrome [Hyphomonas sp.]|uniref:c-type cytochrome n=1 Tax=Hyphomonas sp. TaxID=87 RepID=UPI00391A5DFE
MRAGFALVSLLIALALSACTKAAVDGDSPVPAAPSIAEERPITELDERIGRGEAVAEAACAECHAIGADGDSPHADAPPFRFLHRTVEIGALRQAFAEGKVTDHPDMPDWAFDPLDLDGLVAYLETVQARDPG